MFAPSAGKNRIERMRAALMLYGIEAILVGEGDDRQGAWSYRNADNGPCIGYNAQRISVWRHSRGMEIGAQAARFYRDHLAELVNSYKCVGVIDYASQAQISRSILDAARAEKVFTIVDVVEHFNFSWYNFLNGINWQQYLLCRSVLPRVDGLIGISKGWCDWAARCGIPNVWIPSFAYDNGCIKLRRPQPNRAFTLTFIGHWTPRELPRVFLSAMRLCIDRGVSIRMNVLGNVGLTYRERQAMRFFRRDQVLQEHVKFLGFVSDMERDRLLANSDAFIILRPDNRETDMLFPTRLPEYLLTGNPVILTKAGSFPHCFEHGKDVWFVSPDNRVEEVAEALCFLACNSREREAIGQRGRQTALREFSLEVLGKRLADFVSSIAAKGARQSPANRIH